MSVKIYGIPQSRAARCLWMAKELGIPFENVPVNNAEESKAADFLKLNPNGRIPALVDGDLALCESMAINLYLAKKYDGGKGLYPKSVEDEGRAWQWSFWVMTEIERPVLALLLHQIGRKTIAPAQVEECTAELQRPLKVLESQLQGRDYLLGPSFTVADLNVASVMMWARGAKLDLGPYPKVADWLKRCISRPAAKP